MQLEVGKIYEGKVTGITKFGVFVGFENGQSGMVHISEVAQSFVNEIKDFVTEGQDVKVKVLSISDDGKISLSMKRADETSRDNNAPRGDNRQNRGDRNRDGNRGGHNGGQRNDNRRGQRRSVPEPAISEGRPGDFEWNTKKSDATDFEDMMSKFKQTSDEKMSDLKRATEVKRGYSRRGSK